MAESSTSSADQAAARERDELLATKLNIPQTRPDHLGRSRLIQQLNQGMARELIVVCTPAGFGKTTLLAGWAAGARWPVAWLSLDPEDNDPVRFWRYVVVALDRVAGGLAEHVLPLLSAPRVLSSQGVVTALVNQLQALPGEVALVLDDYHLMESAPVHDAMAFLLGHLPPQLHVVITSRSDPPLPLARLRARGQLAELRAADLRFTGEESAALLREVWGLDLSPEAMAALESRTEGWAVGLQLAALLLHERPDPDAFLGALAGTHRYVLDYLSEEVLERQPARVRTFLLETSILERLSGPLCDAVTGGADGQDMLEELERANLFLVPLDEERRWWRLHHLFGDLLRARLQRAEGARIPELHRRAAAWCERAGLIDEAIRHALASGDATWAARLIEEHLNETLRRGESMILGRWLAVLPDEVVRSRPTLCLALGLREFHLGHLDQVERLLEQAERAVDHRQGQRELQVPTHAGVVAEVPAAIALLRAELAEARGDAEGMAEHARSALAHLAEEEHGPGFWARWLSGPWADWMRGRLADAEPASAEMLAEGRAAADPQLVMLSCLPLGRVQQQRGKLSAALRTYRESLRLATQGGRFSPFHAAEAHLGIAQVLYERNQLDDALRHVTGSVELGRQMIWFYGQELVTSAWIRQAMGEPDSALEAMNEACRMWPSPDTVSLWHPGPSERARLLLAQGRAEEAARWVEERGLTEEDEVSFPRERDHLVLARVLLARSDPARALGLLERLDVLAESQGRGQSLIQVRAVRSLALQSAGDHQGALTALAEALSLARPEGYIRVFADEGPPMAALLQSLIRARRPGRAAVASRAAREYVNRVVQAFQPPVGRAERAAAAATGLIEPLTRREFEVLGFIAAGRPNQEIADQLVVTLETVKKHTSHIFDKLGAANRTEAVVRARELRLIP
ncbi:MAG TPA: LuxR C-terminal-related transcriptional regulator [Actinomycetes bacterium]|jgi:LuxR family maltose regulon positive regulatory protein|nr:LuxR C-terminal-related transcriptional regulator [Actinomycetes bacterium]